MNALGIRARILLATLLPALVVAVLVAALLVRELTEQAHGDQHGRLGAISRQISTLAAYDLFVDNRDALRKLVDAARKDPDIVAAVILDADGRIVASNASKDELPPMGGIADGFAVPATAEVTEHWHRLAILPDSEADHDLFGNQQSQTRPLGHLLLKISNEALHDERRLVVLKAAGISVSILLVALVLALLLSRKMVDTLDDVRQVVEGVGRGYLDMRVQPQGNDELGQLAAGINRMAESVGQTQEHLAARIAEATTSLRQERDDAERASRARSRFFAAASHDLRQPVQALGLFAARLEHDAEHSPLKPGIRQMAESVHKLQSLLNSLLEYSRLDGQAIEVRPQPVRANRLLVSVAEDFAAAAASKRLSLRVLGGDCWLMTDASLLRRILINLIGNAVHYTREGGILVACRRAGGQARIEVWDTGPGIPADQQATIFEELVQLENPERDSEKGLGLGLAIVRRIAELLGHPLALCSRVGHGSRFSLLVPLAAPPAVENDPAEDADLETACRPILIVGGDDGGDLPGQFANWRLRAALATGGETALHWLRQNGLPQFVLFDTQGGHLGILDAEAILARLENAAGRPLPALFITSGPIPERRHKPGEAIRLMLSRPYLPARLRALVMHLIDADGR